MENKKTRDLDNGISVLDVGYRDSTPVALVVKKYKNYDNEYIIGFNYKIKDNKIDWSYGYYYGTHLEKAKKDFADVLLGKNLVDTFNLKSFVDDKEKMQDFYRLSKTKFLESYSYLTEQEYEETKTSILNISKNNTEDVKGYILANKSIIALPIRYFENDKWGTKNVLVHLAEHYKVEIPDNVKKYIGNNLVFYLPEKKKVLVKDWEYERKLDILPYLEQIKEKVQEEHKKLKKKNKERGR